MFRAVVYYELQHRPDNIASSDLEVQRAPGLDPFDIERVEGKEIDWIGTVASLSEKVICIGSDCVRGGTAEEDGSDKAQEVTRGASSSLMRGGMGTLSIGKAIQANRAIYLCLPIPPAL